MLGEPHLELTQNGTVWRFLNEGNRAAFADHPEVYTPRFGGYDPVAIDRGVSVPGNSLIWAVAGDRLYLFYDDKARTEFLANPGRDHRRRRPQMARGRAHHRALTGVQTFSRLGGHRQAGSPQAINPGTRNFAAMPPKLKAAAVRRRHLAAGRGQNGAAGRDIPFAWSATGADRCRPRLPRSGKISPRSRTYSVWRSAAAPGILPSPRRDGCATSPPSAARAPAGCG